MPAPSFLKGLPKPALFALYGAVGGLFGAVLLGEPAWQLLKPPPAPPPEEPPPPPPPPPQVGVSAAAAVRLYPGTANTFPIRVVRAKFEGPVTVAFTNLPARVTIPPVTIPPDQAEAEATVTATSGAAPGTARVALVASGADGKATATASLDVTVVPMPPPPPRLAVAVPPKLAVYKTGECKFAVQIARAGFDGPVAVAFDPVPEGVTVPAVTIPAKAMSAELTLAAGKAAAVGESPIAVTATAAGNPAVKAAVQAEVKVLAPPTAPVDIVFVLDISGSMQYAITGTRDGIQTFAEELGKQQLDVRLGLVGFRDTTLGQPNTILKFGPDEKFTADTALFKEEVGKLRAGGGGAPGESSLDGLADGVEYPFRPGAARVVILITDEPPKNPDRRVKNVAAATDLVKEVKIDQLHLVLYPQLKPTFEPLWKGAKGEYFNLREVEVGKDGFAKLMPDLGKAIAATITPPAAKAEVAPAPAPPTIPAAAAATPVAPEAPPLPVLAPPPPPPEVKGVQSSGGFAKGSEARLLLAIGAWTGLTAGLVGLALLAGQHHYLRGSRPAAGSAAAGFGGGLAAGLVGGLAGQGLYMLAPDNAAAGRIFQVFGWALLGGLVGGGLSLLIPNLKWPPGLAGGALGGAVGAVGFLGVTALAGDLVGRLVGGVAVGLGIGLMVALAEAAFRRAWLEVRYGARETIVVNLGPEPVKVGGDAKACTVWARGAVPVALRFFVRDGRVVCDDLVMKREVTAADGYAKEVGNVTVTVRTGGGGEKPLTASRPPPPAPRSKSAVGAEAPLSLDDPEPLPPPPVPQPRPTVPQGASKPPTPSVPKPAVPAATPKAASPAPPKHPDACPGCGRVNAGPKRSRYCVVCDRTY